MFGKNITKYLGFLIWMFKLFLRTYVRAALKKGWFAVTRLTLFKICLFCAKKIEQKPRSCKDNPCLFCSLNYSKQSLTKKKKRKSQVKNINLFVMKIS